MKRSCLPTFILLAACSRSGEATSDDASAGDGSMAPAQSAAAAGNTVVAATAGRAATQARAGVAGAAMAAAAAAGSGKAGAGAAGATAAGGGAGTAAAGSGATVSTTPGAELIWPNDESSANSDPWLATNHDKITQLRPRVLVIDLESTDETKAKKLIDQHIASLKESSSFHKYKEPTAQPAVAYELVKIAHASKGGGRVDYNSWNTQSFADSAIQLKDPKDPNGPNLTLCGLFEKGVINEVWCMASSDPKCGETQEYKQVYEMDGPKVPSSFKTVSNGDDISSLGCKVSARITDFNSGRGAGCHQHALGHAWERYMDGNAVPQLGQQAKRFLNWDLDTRVKAPFSNFYSACRSNGSQLTDCIQWSSEIEAKSGPSATKTFDLADMSGGCGNAHFYANTTGTYSYDANEPDPEVLTSCENYGMHNGMDGKDLTTSYTNAMTDKQYGRSMRDCPADQPACDDDCGGHGTAYLYQNFPGPGTQAKNDDGTPMHNWWVYLFY